MRVRLASCLVGAPSRELHQHGSCVSIRCCERFAMPRSNHAFEPTPDCIAASGVWPRRGAAQRGRQASSFRPRSPMRNPLAVELLILALTLLPQATQAQEMDPALRGNWTLSVAKSSFGPDGPPSAGTVRWTEHGWVL